MFFFNRKSQSKTVVRARKARNGNRIFQDNLRYGVIFAAHARDAYLDGGNAGLKRFYKKRAKAMQ